MVTLEARTRCPIDGCHVRWLTFPSVRVNKRSMRQLDGGHLSWRPDCPECGLWPAADTPSGPWRLTAQSQAEVDAYRARKFEIGTEDEAMERAS